MTSTYEPVMQGAPSIYMFLGALQSALWFFALPPLLRPLWPSIFELHSPQISEVLLWTAIIPYVILYSLVVALPPYLLEWDFFEQFKISKDPWPWKDKREGVREQFWKLTRRSLLIDSVNLLVFVPFFAYVKVILLPSRALSLSVDDWPSCFESFPVIITSVVVHEFGFYWT
jgi:hypothetical protein